MGHTDDSGNPAASGGLVESVEPDSPAELAGIKAGDRIRSLDGYALRDVIDYQFRVEPAGQEVELERDGTLVKLEIDNQEQSYPGIVFSSTLFDGVRVCRCNCAFCFVDQVPGGLRDALYLKDDDYRLSFLYGNFVTLNNLEPGDVERIIEQRLSPLYVSIHATAPDVRARLMGCAPGLARAGLENLRRLGEAGIATHVQVVLCPGVNDGAVLEQTVTELDRDFPAVASVGIVPVAVGEETARAGASNRVPLRPFTADECRRVVETVTSWQARFRRELGLGFVYAADEFYLLAGLSLPPLGEYDELPQYENGIGIGAVFQQEAARMLGDQLQDIASGSRIYLLTGVLARPVVEETLKALRRQAPGWLGDVPITPLTATNWLFGPHVTVTGLLGGRDIITAAGAAGLRRGDILLMPEAVLDSTGERCLDGLTLAELDEILECTIRVV